MAHAFDVAPPSPGTLEEQLTEEFYRWELRGRGWQVWDAAILPEPPFRPFLGHYGAVHVAPPIDDARKPTFLGSLLSRLAGRTRNDAPAAIQDDEPLPDLDETEEHLVEVTVALPNDTVVTKARAEQLLLALSNLAYPVAFEVIGRAGTIVVAIACRNPDAGEVRRTIASYFPEATVAEATRPLAGLLQPCAMGKHVVVDFGLSREFMLPLKCPTSFDVDPLTAVIGALSELQDSEVGVFQVLFQAARHPWAPSIVRAVTDWDGEPFFHDTPELVTLAHEKIERPLFAAVLRVAAQGAHRERAWEIVRAIGAGLAPFSTPAGNELIPLADDDYPPALHAEDFVARKTHRNGMLLSSEELAALVHLPSSSVRVEGLLRQVQKTAAAPKQRGDGIVLGENVHRGKTRTVTLDPSLRTRHAYVIGASGTGKSTLLLNMLVQDIERGDGVGLIDPHGDFVDEVLGRIPEHRVGDVVLFDPADDEYPVGFNILQAHSELERNLLASDLVAVFRRFATSWGDQMTSVLGNAILAFLESDLGGTLLDLRRFLLEPEFRRSVLATVTDPEVLYYFEREFPLLKGHPAAPLLTRLDAFLRPKMIRRMVGQRESRLDLRAVMDGRKIFLAKLAHGLVGEENAYLLGALLVAKFYELALTRQAQAESTRQDFYLYIDEFHHFATPSLATLLSGARKYHLGLVLAHQELKQLAEREPGLVSSVLTNPATRICFQLGSADARVLAQGFASFKAEDFENLGKYEAICRFERRDADFTLRTRPSPNVDPVVAQKRRGDIIARSRAAWARPRADVDQELREALGALRAARGEEPASATELPARYSRQAATRMPAEANATQERPASAPPRETAASRPAPEPPPKVSPSTPGRGGTEHKYLQHLVKRLAEDRGWRATIEAEALGGVGQVDVALERDGQRIACEITVTTSDDHELGNIQKCLAAGYDEIVVLAADKKALRTLERLVADALSPESTAKVRCLSPEAFVSYLDERDAVPTSRAETVRGYTVKVNYKPTNAADAKARKEAIARVLAGGLKRLK